MRKKIFSLGCFVLGLLGLIALLGSVLAACFTNNSLMEQGFLKFGTAKEQHGVLASQYSTYSKNICDYLDGKTQESLFQEAAEQAQLRSARGWVTGLKLCRWIGGGLCIAGLAALYFLFKGEERTAAFQAMFRGFAWAALGLLVLSALLTAWGYFGFESFLLFFRGDAAGLSGTLLASFTPNAFFRWYAGVALTNLLPVFGILLFIPIAWRKLGKQG